MPGQRTTDVDARVKDGFLHEFAPAHAPTLRMDVQWGRGEEKNLVWTWPLNDTTAQHWAAYQVPKSEYFYLVPACAPTFCLDARGGPYSPLVLGKVCGSPSQHWRVQPVKGSSDEVVLFNALYGDSYAADVCNENHESGAAFLLWEYHGRDNQRMGVKVLGHSLAEYTLQFRNALRTNDLEAQCSELQTKCSQLEAKVTGLTAANTKAVEALSSVAAQVLSLRSAPVAWPSDMSDECAAAVARSLYALSGSFQTPTRQVCGFRLRSVDIVRNSALSASFSAHVSRMKNLRHGDEALFHHTCEYDEQREVLHTLKTLFHPVLPGAWRDPRTLTVYHGCRASTARKIANVGFVDLSAQDSGFFGHGIYASPNAEYACQYATGTHCPATEPHSPEHPDWFAVLLCTAVVGLVYPVTRQVDYEQAAEGHSKLYGQPLKPRYDAHFALVHSRFGYEASSPPGVAQYGELCVSQYAALLPLAILWVSSA